jgi:hypothetical protein
MPLRVRSAVSGVLCRAGGGEPVVSLVAHAAGCLVAAAGGGGGGSHMVRVRAAELSHEDGLLGPLALVAAVALDEAEGGVVALAWSAAAEAGEREPALFAGSGAGAVWELRLRGGALEPLRRLQVAGLTHLSGAGAGGVLAAGLLGAPARWAPGRAEELPQLRGLFVSALLALPEPALGCEDGGVWGLRVEGGGAPGAPGAPGASGAACAVRLGEPVAALVRAAESGVLAVGRGGRVALLGRGGGAWQLLASSQLAGVRGAVRGAALAGGRRLYVVAGARLLQCDVGLGEAPWPAQLAAHEVPLLLGLAAAPHGLLAVAACPVLGAGGGGADLVVVHGGGGAVCAALVSHANPAEEHRATPAPAPGGVEALEASLARLAAAGAQEAALREAAATVAAELQQLGAVASVAAATCSVNARARARAGAPGPQRAEAELVVRLRGVHADGCTLCVSVEREPAPLAPLVQLGPAAARLASWPLAELAGIAGEPGRAVEAIVPLVLLSPLPLRVRVDVLWSHGSRTVASAAVPVAHLVSPRAESPAAALRAWLYERAKLPSSSGSGSSSRQPATLRELALFPGGDRWRAADWAVCACLRAERASNDDAAGSDERERSLARRRRRLEPAMLRRLAAARNSIALGLDAALPECARLYLALREAHS